ncbi:eukaryotic cytochrome b561-domain-containing protein [Microdochium trichocladiopsis]|uniref:Eukaryotic cytochrome b561-domain-containing protein n=1 Tax=Microdochium trichocladiopsis TaxID=1682393 RepID=A0A9P8YI27_9PEZI|nr:eukaryotic cytochrome b561-domain-containing protein [Microdochium trichocladiopsis]KAH7040789.1 eukaryotic cytochrome b561-domain-containing protein [Microdochium trichocladiopsis]
MASATGIPQQPPAEHGNEESEPLLGRPGDASQKPAASIAKNLVLGTGVVAEAGGLLLVASVWAAVFLHPPYILFSVHPLAQSFGLLVLIQSILIVQPTVTAEQKKVGQKLHAGLNFLALASFIVGVGSIEYNKIRSNGAHFKSPHAYIGIVASIWQILQYVVGFTMYGAPQLYGGEAKAKAIWKYHRMSGYGLLLLYMAAVTSATKTDYNVNVLGLKLWAAIVIALLVIAGIYPRIKKQKLGL